MSKYKLYLDDVRIPRDPEWILVKDYNEFVDTVTKYGVENFSTISLDHDLGDTAMSEYYNNVVTNSIIDYDNITEKTGLDCAKWLIDHYLEIDRELEIDKDEFIFPMVYSHSANPIGAANIIGYVNNFLKNMNQEQTCIRVRIDHYIPDDFIMTLEEREKKWKNKPSK